MTFYYDGDCGFCQWSARKLTGLADVEIRPARLDDFAIYDNGESKELGHKAIGAVLKQHGRAKWARAAGTVLLFRPLSPLFAGVYRLVAINRHKLGPLVGEESCAIR
ncbi:hypothetical protein [Corynebacterium dentalis]|uniref:hypothetical protein n=1 Tax=Corynebacterium dentalis TaxID=2014528 RepID=UPI002896D8D7|nr:hypothetical protein [Corynebacterium dentalis]